MSSEHRGQTDQAHEVKLTSSIEQVVWARRMVAAGCRVGLEVFTHHVGNGAKLEIQLTDHNGTRHGSFKERITGNRFSADVDVPRNVNAALYAKVKLTKHGLSMKSAPLIVTPPIDITNVRWDKEEARRGDTLLLTADVEGVPDGTEAEITIWEHDADGAHDLITRFPVTVDSEKVEAEWEFEYHEDTDDIPRREDGERDYNPPEYFFRVLVQGYAAESGLLEFKDWIRITLVDSNGDTVPDAEYVLHLPDGSERRGTLNSEGYAEEEDVPPGVYFVVFPERPSGEADESDDAGGTTSGSPQTAESPRESTTACPTKVEFREDGDNYGWDDFTDSAVPWKSVQKGETCSVRVIITPGDTASNVEFDSSDTGKVTVSPKKATSASQVLSLTGVANGETDVKAICEGTTIAKFRVKTYTKKSKTVAVRLVHEKNYRSTDVSDAVIKLFLRKVYKQAAFDFVLTRLPAKTVEFDKNGDGKIDVDSWMSDEMKAIRAACKDDSYDHNIFLVDNPSDGSTGFMSYNQRYGFVHAGTSSKPESTVAHELGHGGFGLVHTSSDSNNIMYDYASATKWRLRKNQCDKINN